MYQIITDGSCDLAQENIEKYGLKVIPFYVTMDGKTYQKEIEEIGIREFYQMMVDMPKQFPMTSLPSVQDYMEVFEPVAEQGKDIICICITTKFSGSYNSAISAKELLAEKYPDIKVAVIDSRVNTVLQGLVVLEAAKMQKQGCSFEEVLEHLDKIIPTARIFFTIGNMDYLVHGGRVGKLSGIAAGKLGIKPLILLKEGEIFPNGLARGRIRSMEKVLDQVMQYIEDGENDPDKYSISVGYGYDIEEGKRFREKFHQAIREKYPDAKEEVQLMQIGAMISVHTGPYPIGVGIVRRWK